MEKDNIKACVNFARLHREIVTIGRGISHVASNVDEWVQNEVDRLRGK
jgi:hypothetical protein